MASSQIPTTQKALVVEKVGSPITLHTRPTPAPQSGEILLQITVAALNPYDKHVRDTGLYVEDRMPAVLSNDMAGIVRAIGPDTQTDLKIGDHVFGQTNYLKKTNDQCGCQEYAVLDAFTAAKVPEGFSDHHGASCVTNVVSPFWAVFGIHGLGLPFPFAGTEHQDVDYSGHTIAIIGGGSNCGKYGVQAAAIAGFGRIVVVANKARNERQLKDYGATHVIDRTGTDQEVEARVRAVVGNTLIYALDAVNLNHNLGLAILSTKQKGTLACLVPGLQNDLKFQEKENGYEEKFLSGISHNQPELGRRFWEALPGWMAEGKIRANDWSVIDGLDAGAVNTVLDEYAAGGTPAKQVHVCVNGRELVKQT